MSDGPGRIDGGRVWQHRFLDAHLDRVRFPDGSEGEQVLIHHPGASAVVPFLSDIQGKDPQVLLLKQYRYAVADTLWEIPAGRLEPAEAPLACAHRELKEETGCTAAKMELLTSMWTTPGFTNEKIHIFMASELTRGSANRESDEFIEVVPTPLTTALRMIEAGEITDAKTIIGLLFAAGFRS
ncbi:MAG: NUDIX hydrolase [Gemmatimonadales bacterium]|nr:NUDIX hydrolase [Gemmatimonadota bacterium]MCL4214825.1 NUDIX hydrolase [Gemmatimonadales bacterium]